MLISKYEGTVYLTETQLSGKIRMYLTSGKEYFYRYRLINPLLQHIKRKA